MKTKYLLAALAVPAVFTACTSDELENMNTNTGLDGRIALENVSFAVNQGSETRLAIGESSFNALSFEENDGMGACLIDVMSGSDTDPVKNYQLNENKIQTNYRFNYANGIWTSQANLVEGNYMFYMPYNADHQSRSAISINLPTTQTFSKDADGTFTTLPDVVKKSVESGAPLAVGYKFLKAGDSNMQLDLKLQQLYAYPKFTLQNIESTDINVSYITLASETSKFLVKAPFEFAASASQTAYTEAGSGNSGEGSFVASFYNKEEMGGDGTVDGTWFLDKNTEAVKMADLVDGSGANAKVTAIELMVSEDAPMVIKSGATVSFRAAIPAGNYDDMVIEVHTTDGKVARMSLTEFDINPRRQYTVAGYASETSLTADPSVDLTTTVVGLTADDSKLINSSIELLQAINAFAPTDENKILKLKINSSDVEINRSVTDILNNKTVSVSGSKIIFTSDVTINAAGELKGSSNLALEFQGNVTVKGTNNVLKSSNLTVATGKKITVAEGGVADIQETFTGVAIENNGTLNVTTALTSGDVTNKGTLNLGATLTAKVANKANIVVAKSAAGQIEGNVNNEGKLTVNGTYNLSTSGASGAEYVFTNKENGSIAIAKGATFSGTTQYNTFINEAKGVVENAGKFNVAETTDQGCENKGTINTTGAVTIDKNTGVININSVLASVTVNTTAGTWGNIYQNDTMDGTVSASSADQYIWKTISGGSLEAIPSGSNYNSIVFDGVTLAIDASGADVQNTDLKAISFKNGSLTVTGGGSYALKFTATKEVTFDGNVNVLGKSSAIIQFADNTVMTINKGAVVNFIGENGKGDLTIKAATGTGMIIKNNGSVTSRATFTNIDGSSSKGTWAGDAW